VLLGVVNQQKAKQKKQPVKWRDGKRATETFRFAINQALVVLEGAV